jgi:hypothetical protein
VDAEPPAEPAPKRAWYRPRWWWSIPGAVIVIAGVSLAVFAGSPKANAPGAPAAATRSGGSSGSTGTGNSEAVGSGYLANESGAVVFIQWTTSGDQLSGSAQVETLKGTPPNATVSTQTLSVMGQLVGATGPRCSAPSPAARSR